MKYLFFKILLIFNIINLMAANASNSEDCSELNRSNGSVFYQIEYNNDYRSLNNLIKQGCPIDKALFFAKNLKTFEILIKAGADVNSKRDESDPANLLHYLAWNFIPKYNQAEIIPIAKLLIKAGINIEARDGFGNTPIMNAFRDAGITQNFNLLKFYLNEGANINDVDDYGENILHQIASLACQRKFGPNFKICNRDKLIMKVMWAVENGLSVNSRDNYGQTPLFKAVKKGAPEVVNYLIEKGAKLESRTLEGNTPIMGIVARGKYFGSDHDDYYWAARARKESIEILDLLIAAGANPKAVQSNSWTVLDWFFSQYKNDPNIMRSELYFNLREAVLY